MLSGAWFEQFDISLSDEEVIKGRLHHPVLFKLRWVEFLAFNIYIFKVFILFWYKKEKKVNKQKFR